MEPTEVHQVTTQDQQGKKIKIYKRTGMCMFQNSSSTSVREKTFILVFIIAIIFTFFIFIA